MSLSSPSLENIIELTKIFGVSADFLVANTDKILVDITSLSNEEREAVIRLINCLRKEK